MDLKPDFLFTSVSKPVEDAPDNSLVPLDLLPGLWKGTGFNQIWRPFDLTGNPPGHDHFLELNLTSEQIVFTVIGSGTTPGEIANRGLLQGDIPLFGVTYLQQISDVNAKTGIHVEPGIWVNVPKTTNPSDAATVARMASIPHGTTIVAQGIASTVAHGPTGFPNLPVETCNIAPFGVGGTQSATPGQPSGFPESDLLNLTPSVVAFRSPAANLVGITQAMVNNPNTVLQAGIAGKNITEMTVLTVSTSTTFQTVPSTGGGSPPNIAFLAGASAGPNAFNLEVDATFWIETITDHGKVSHQLQYAQRVLLKFNNLIWPHISVATLTKQ